MTAQMMALMIATPKSVATHTAGWKTLAGGAKRMWKMVAVRKKE